MTASLWDLVYKPRPPADGALERHDGQLRADHWSFLSPRDQDFASRSLSTEELERDLGETTSDMLIRTERWAVNDNGGRSYE